jgi:transcriptional regulator with XRE-family HTH domain
MEPNQTSDAKSTAKRIALEVRAEMTRQSITQESLGARIGWDQRRVSRRLTGEVALDVAELATIADALGVPVTKFLTASAVTA